ncbi:hypothetical protein J9332_38560, partial [Aquimarina celericrescens]|nr:hypothetical protein [Aquimarina celericrescens]
VHKENAKKLTIQMDVADLDEAQVMALQDLFSSHTGDHILNFVVYEMKNKIKIHMPSKSKKVNISTELISALEEHKINYKHN